METTTTGLTWRTPWLEKKKNKGRNFAIKIIDTVFLQCSSKSFNREKYKERDQYKNEVSRPPLYVSLLPLVLVERNIYIHGKHEVVVLIEEVWCHVPIGVLNYFTWVQNHIEKVGKKKWKGGQVDCSYKYVRRVGRSK